MPLRVPSRHNERLSQLLVRINDDLELHQLWKCANINAVDRTGMSDHGEVHIRIAANAALKMLRLLADAGVETSVVKEHDLTYEDAEVIVVLAACLHDVGMSVHRHNHEQHSLILAAPKARDLLCGIYEEPDLTIMVSEVLHVEGVKCRGSSTLFAFFLNRNDIYEIGGYLKLEAWPDPHTARVKVSFDPDQTDRRGILEAVTEPYYDQADDRWRNSPFIVEGYDPLAVDE